MSRTALYSPTDMVRWSQPDSAASGGGIEHRSAFQIDRDRVVFSFAFRRLQSKTQVFQSGEYDFYRTRLTHSLEVARIARSLCELLRKASEYPFDEEAGIDSDLVEAIGLSHDLGHPPFGHIGERRLNELMEPWGGFEGNAQTARILTDLIWENRLGPAGMAPTRAFLDGVLKYKALHRECVATEQRAPENHFLYDAQEPLRRFIAYESPALDGLAPDALNRLRSIECQIMDWADDTAYCLHDLVDGWRAGFITERSVDRWAEGKTSAEGLDGVVKWLIKALKEDRLERSVAGKVGDFIRTCRLVPQESPLAHLTARHAWHLQVEPDLKREAGWFKLLAHDLIFRSTALQQLEFKGGYILQQLFEAILEQYLRPRARSLRLLPEAAERSLKGVEGEPARARLICDFLAGCTDAYAIRLHQRLFRPDYGSITDLT